jgi:thiamine-monophosphate kinase
VITRTGARLGDWIYVTGALGGSLRRGRHFRFTPRLAEGAWLSRQAEVRAMMDVSDGLAKDLHALTPPGTTPALDATSLPRRPGCDLRAALTDGEDYELLFVLRRNSDRDRFSARWRRSFPRTRLSCLGQFVAPDKVPANAIPLREYHGYEHLR